MKRFLTFLLILFFAVSSCSQFPPKTPRHYGYTRVQAAPYLLRNIPVYISGDFGEEDKVHIDDALQQWNYALNGYMKFTIVSTHFDMSVSDIIQSQKEKGLIILRVNSDCKFIPKTATPETMSIAWADLTTHGEIYLIRDRLQTQDIFPVTLHEVGHIIGADHDPRYGLMNPTYDHDQYACIDSNAVDQIANYNNLPREKLNSCFDN